MSTEIKKQIDELKSEISEKQKKLDELQATVEPDDTDVENIVDQL